ncbi:MAG: hypothetical protein H6568_03285 [Lewinellaceae bacterium]|nr:hypothetical protein [Saprospiraceae bacterium]MCB9311765.1 hypothetical protein [Lewinellaceae bacterium]
MDRRWTRVGWIVLLHLPWFGAISAQQPGMIRNSGFEASFSTSFLMPDWLSWGAGSTPDIQPGQWGVVLPPRQGYTYLGLINREDGTREGVYQKLQIPLEAGRCYYFTIALACARDYAGFKLPLSLEIKGVAPGGGKPFRLVRSPLVTHDQWQIYTMEFTPEQPVGTLILEAAPGPGVLIHYRGNLLLDAMSGVGRCIRASL